MKLIDILLEKRQRLSNFRQQELEIEKEDCISDLSSEEITKMLDNIIIDFFPKTGRWSSYEFNHDDTLIHNLRNVEEISRRIKRKHSNIPLSSILEYVKTSKIFKEQRDAYEQRIVKWQIEWMLGNGAGFIIPKGFGDMMFMMPDYDIGFRQAVVETLLAIEINKESIERGLEENSSLWMDKVMSRAFQNEFDPIEIVFINKSEKEHQEKWIKMRKFEYYKQHKKSVDKYGTVLPEMQLSNEEVVELYLYLNEKNAERKAFIAENGKMPTIKLDF